MALTKIQTNSIQDDAITNAKIADDAIDTPQIADGAVDTVNIADLNVDTGKITNDAVTEAKIANDAVRVEHILSGAVTDSELASNAVTGAKIASGAVSLNKLASDSVGTVKIIDQAVTLAKLPHGTSSNDGKFLRANNGADPTFETVSSAGKATNLIINGAMTVAQYGTSSTSNGYKTVDRFNTYTDNIGVTPTYSQVDVTSGGAYDAGFRKAWQVTKGAGTANSASQVNIGHKIEARDIRNSGWKYTDPNSKITISFWIKTSVSNHNPQLLVLNQDTTNNSTKCFQVDIPTLTANTWTKVTTVIPGHADQNYNDDTGTGLEIQWIAWYGTDYTDAGNTMDAWSNFGTKPVDSTWLTTNNSTFQLTGVQLEVGDAGTDFAFEPYAETVRKCQRYYWKIAQNTFRRVNGYKRADSNCYWELQCPVPMRTNPSPTLLAGGTFTNFNSNFGTTQSGANVNEWNQSTGWGLLYVSSNWSTTSASIPSWEGYSIEFSAEL